MAILHRLLPSACLLLAACAAVPNRPAASNAEKSIASTTAAPEADTTFPLTTEIDASIPARYRKSIELAQIEGRFLFREDRAAWVATDAVVAKGIIDRNRTHATGWLSEQLDVTGDLWDVVFTGKEDGKSFAYADVNVDFSGPKPLVTARENSPPRALSDLEGMLALGRSRIAAKDWLRCADTYNTSTQLFIDEGKRYIVVRMMPAWKEQHIQPMGGFHRFRIPVSENDSIEHFAQTNTCLDVDTTKTEPAATFGMTLLTSPTPTEFDVFTSLSYGRPHYVITSDAAWRVEKGKIHWIDDRREKAP